MKPAPLDPLGPPLVRQAMRQGPNATMPSAWRDPDDTKPTAARDAREIAGHRAYCPLRWMRRRHGRASRITVEHVVAADYLRRAADEALYGCGGTNMLAVLGGGAFGPLSGPGSAALRQARAWREYTRAMALMDAHGRAVITSIVLLNHSLASWCRERGIPAGSQQPEMDHLVGMLDRLVEHYAGEIAHDLAQDRVLAD